MRNYLSFLRHILWVPLIGLALLANPAMAVDDDGLFELDGNAEQSGDPGDDWDTPPAPIGGANEFTGILQDLPPLTIFRGGRKDIQEISQWGHKGGAVPDKDDLRDAYAAAYRDADDHLVVYFGADRFANVGDAFMAFWFFKNKIEAVDRGAFSGEHAPAAADGILEAVGDVLILVDYPQGANATPEISVVGWEPDCGKAASNNPIPGECAATNLLLVAKEEVECAPGGDDDFCAITNAANETAPWPYDPKAGTSGVFPPESFYEGGIDLTAVIGGSNCFSSFMAETRSSESFTATLKDFVLSDFDLCSVKITKECSACNINLSETGVIFNFGGTVENDGFGTLFNCVVTDNAGTPGDTSDDLTFLLGTITGGDTVPWGGTLELFTADPNFQNPITNQASVVCNSAPTGTDSIADTSASSTCPQCAGNGALQLTKTCETRIMEMDNKVVVVVDYAGMACNSGDPNNPLDLGLNNVVVVDNNGTPGVPEDDTTHEIGDLPVANDGSECKPYSGTIIPSSSNSTVPSEVTFSDTVDGFGFTNLFNDPVQADMPVTATCPLCPPLRASKSGQ